MEMEIMNWINRLIDTFDPVLNTHSNLRGKFGSLNYNHRKVVYDPLSNITKGLYACRLSLSRKDLERAKLNLDESLKICEDAINKNRNICRNNNTFIFGTGDMGFFNIYK